MTHCRRLIIGQKRRGVNPERNCAGALFTRFVPLARLRVHDTTAPDDAQQFLQIEETASLATLDLVNLAAPASPGDRSWIGRG